MHAPIYILGGSQTDFARNWAREGLEIYDPVRRRAAGSGSASCHRAGTN